jgi:uncharacterized protein (TIGR03086 family)
MSDVTDRATHLVSQFDARVQAAPADSWGNQSPCAEWTARDVVVHVANSIGRATAGLAGTEPHEVGSDDEITAAWATARDAFLAALVSGDLTATVQSPFGPMPAEQMIGRLTCTDVLVHTWDLARAVGGDETLDADAVAGAFSGLKPMDAMIRMPGVFGPKVEAPSDADQQTEFLTFLGRTV